MTNFLRVWSSPRRAARALHVLLAVVVWVPLLLTDRGRVASDTRQDMYLDAGRFLTRARHLWDPLVHFGTVTHQNLGLIVPMGTWFWSAEALGIPVWVAQRLWLGGVIFAAAAGVLHLGRTLAWQPFAAATAAVVYALSPYVLQYATRTSVLLLPFAGLPWMISLILRASRTGSWRHPALFALVVFLVGSVNATSLLLVGVGPALWLPYAVVTRQLSARGALAVAAKVGVLSLAVSAWWIVALAVQSRYGLPVLTYTETIDDVATTAAAQEVLRGLGYWVFYGREVLDPNVAPAVAYTQNPALLTLSYLLPALGLAAAAFVRFRHRGYFVGLIVLGALVSVGAHPIDDPSSLASGFRSAADATAGLALRSSTRAVPLLVLGLAACLGQGAAAIARSERRGWIAAGAIGMLAMANLPALFTGGLVDEQFSRPEELPGHWQEAAAWFRDDADPGAVLELPGIQYATYRWGTTYEPVTPGLLDRPVIAREQLPYGSPASADLLIALDRRLQEGVPDQSALSPVARLLGARWVLLRNDLAFERYLSPRPRALWSWFQPAPDGLRSVASFGEPVENRPDARLPLLDEEALGLSDDVVDPSPVEVFEVSEPRRPIRLQPSDGVLVIDGDGEGIVDAAAAGLLEGAPTLRYASSLLNQPDELSRAADDDGLLVITDTNRKRVRRWRSVRWGTGYTERADEGALSAKLGDAGLEVFDPIPEGSQSTVLQRGAAVDATTYGGPFTLDPDARPALAVDGRADTAWVVGPFTDPVGERLTVRPDAPAAVEHLTVLQRQGQPDRRIAELDISVNGAAPQRIALDESSMIGAGQRIPLADGPVASLEVTIAAVDGPGGATAPVGLAEIGFGGVVVDEIVRLPTRLLGELADVGGIADRPISYLLTRLRSDPSEPVRADEEGALRRQLWSPSDQALTVSGEARLSPRAEGSTLDQLLGVGGSVAHASSELPGALERRASAAIDGDMSTRWSPAFRDLRGAWIEVDAPEPVTIDRLDVGIVADGRHSVPTQLTVDVDGQVQTVPVPVITDDDEPGATQSVRVALSPVSGQRVRMTIADVRPATTIDYYTRAPIELPVGIAELGVPGIAATGTAATVDTGCRSDLVSVDGVPVPVQITGAATEAVDRRPLALVGCGPIPVSAGNHLVEASEGALTGLDLDRLVLSTSSAPVPTAADFPDVRLDEQDPTSIGATVPPTAPAYLVLGQSHSDGWRATLDGEDLGSPMLVDGASNGWRIDGSTQERSLRLEWTPQRWVDRGLMLSAAAVLLCLLLCATRARPWHRDAAPPRPASLSQHPVRLGALERVAVGGLTIVAAGTVHPLAAAPVLAGALACFLWPTGAAAVRVAVAAVWTAAAGWVIVTQIVAPRRPDFEWIAGSYGPHVLALTSLLLLLTVTVTDHLRHRRNPEESERVEGGTTWSHLWRRALGIMGLPSRAGANADDHAEPATTERPITRRRRLVADPDEQGADSRRFALASALGAIAALVVFGWLLTLGRADLTSWQRVGDFYDGQAEAWLDGHWDMAPETLGIERFEARGKAYMYQGPWPALLRVPVVAVTDRFEGRMTQASMLGAFVVAMAGASLLHWRIRRLVRGAATMGRAETLSVGLATFTVGAGSALLFVASRAWVYHEAIAWGVAWSLVSFACIVACITGPSWRRFALAGAAAALALCSRSSVGLGPVVALALLGTGNALALLGDGTHRGSLPQRVLYALRWFGGAPGHRGRRPVVGPMVAAVLPLGVYAATNWIKFRTLFSIPFATQGFTTIDEGRRSMLDQNDGTLFGLQFLPTTLRQYFRPDGLSLTQTFPFVDFPVPLEPIGHVQFDLIDWSGSIPVTMPALTVLAVVAAVVLIRHPVTERGQGMSALRIPVAGALGGALTMLPFGYIAHRYLADAVPLLAVGGLVGLQVVLGWSTTARPRVRAGAMLMLGALALVSLWVNLSLGMIYQRLYSPGVKDDVTATFLDQRYDAAQRLGLDPPIPLARVDELPLDAPRGAMAVIGECDALYLSDGMDVNSIKVTPWNAVERREVGGRWLRRVSFEALPEGSRQPIYSMRSAEESGILFAEWMGGDGVRFVWDGPGSPITTPTRYLPAGRAWTLDLVVDPHVMNLQVWLDDVLTAESYFEPTSKEYEEAVGRDLTGTPGMDAAFSGLFEPLPERVGVCDELLDEAAEG